MSLRVEGHFGNYFLEAISTPSQKSQRTPSTYQIAEKSRTCLHKKLMNILSTYEVILYVVEKDKISLIIIDARAMSCFSLCV